MLNKTKMDTEDDNIEEEIENRIENLLQLNKDLDMFENFLSENNIDNKIKYQEFISKCNINERIDMNWNISYSLFTLFYSKKKF